MSNSHKRDYAPGKTKGTGKLGSFCQGFTESDCVKAKSACHWVQAKTPYCSRRIQTKANMNALSKFNDNKTLSDAKELAEITIAFSMYHENGDKMTTEEILEKLELESAYDHFRWWLIESVLQDYGVSEDGYEIQDIDFEEKENFILVTIPIAVGGNSQSLDVNDTIRELQIHLNKYFKKMYEFDTDMFIKSATIVNQNYNRSNSRFSSQKKVYRGVEPSRTLGFNPDRQVKRAQKKHKEMMESLARGEEL